MTRHRSSLIPPLQGRYICVVNNSPQPVHNSFIVAIYELIQN